MEFIPKYLAMTQIDDLYKQALIQAETVVMQAWINYLLNKEDSIRLATFEQAKSNLLILEADLNRIKH